MQHVLYGEKRQKRTRCSKLALFMDIKPKLYYFKLASCFPKLELASHRRIVTPAAKVKLRSLRDTLRLPQS